MSFSFLLLSSVVLKRLSVLALMELVLLALHATRQQMNAFNLHQPPPAHHASTKQRQDRSPTALACVDLAAPGMASTCPSQRYLCTVPLYQALMRQQCPKTCGYC
ncbi:unnamed protein product [Toxocara canis]|uniref:ShKT domain-containing protein n=1 Tax=Toxocara canis TaxID=6265 RepID=A0A3P7GE89_TOXCA|nr:unnamed protein product [Toxocara canis]